MNRNLLATLTFTFCLAASAQGPNEGFIMENEATQHLLTHPEPIYPPIAKAAHVQGTVLLHLDVDATGKVTRIEAIGGPAMLRAAAIDAVKRWTYKPFEANGAPAAVKVVVSVPFSLGIPDATEKSDQAIGQAYFPKSNECRSLNASGKWSDATIACGDALTIAERFPNPNSRANELRTAHEQYGEALAFSGDMIEALEQFHQTVAIARKSLTPTDAEYGGAYYWQAFAEHSSKLLTEADADYTTAESSFRKAMVNLPNMSKIYGRELAHTLAYHSVLARQTGRDAEAAKMQAEALQLDPHSLDGINGSKQ